MDLSMGRLFQVQYLALGGNQLTGSIPSLPSTLTNLDLDGNQLTGGIPSLPSNLSELRLWNNQLSGGILSLPSNLTYLDLGGNQLTGNIRVLPSGLTHLNLGTNLLTGNISFTWPSGLTYFHADKNQFTGTLPATVPAGLNELCVYGNQLTGDLPNFPSALKYLSLGYLGYPGNRFTGTLVLTQPEYLSINDSQITDVVIANNTQLTICDLSNNPLLGNPNIVNLIMCTTARLYALPNLFVTRSVERITGIKWTAISTESQLSNQTMTAIHFDFNALVPVLTLLDWIFMGLRLLINMGILATIIAKAPWSREWKNKKKQISDKMKGLLDLKVKKIY